MFDHLNSAFVSQITAQAKHSDYKMCYMNKKYYIYYNLLRLRV